MKQKMSLLSIVIILVLPIALYAFFKAPGANLALEAATGKPLVLEFSSPMCSECLKLKKVLDVVEPKYEERISFQKINATLPNPDVTEKIQKYSVTLVPTTVFIDTEGKIIAKKEGYMNEKTLVSHLEELVK